LRSRPFGCGGVGGSALFGFFLVAGLLFALGSRAETGPGYAPLYAELLSEYTHSVDAEVGTRVDYSGLAKEPRWKRLLSKLAEMDPSRLGSREEKLAFWINAYNIFAIDLVILHSPVKSIRDIGSFFRPVWKREAGRIGGRGYSLDEIENEILRPMKEPRIHGAIVCASISCPNLAQTPYRAPGLDAQLDASIRAWLARPEKGLSLDRAKGRLELSRIFKWFAEDFGGRKGVLEFVQKYAPEPNSAWLAANLQRVSVSYFDYNWNLNQ